MTVKSIGTVIVIAFSAMVAGCATMSPEECKRADWLDIGLRDGLSGKPMYVLDNRIKACTEAGAAVDTSRYITGRNQGLQSFCSLENASVLGLSGASYAGVCPALIDIEFRRRYQIGHAVYILRAELNNLIARSDKLQHQLREIDQDEDKHVKEANKDEDRRRIRSESDDRRHHLRDELRELDQKERRTREELRAAEFSLENLR